MKKPVAASELPDVLFADDLAALLGTSVRTIQKRMKSRSWPYTPLPRIDRRPRWSKTHVLAVIEGQARPSYRKPA